MTGDSAARVLDRRRQTVAAQRATIAATTRAHSDQAGGLNLPHPIGARVFDVVSGEHGAVVGGAPYGAQAGARVDVQLASGVTVTRAPAHVLPRPAPPTGRSGGA